MVDFNPKVVSKEELRAISAGVNEEELLLFDNHCLNNYYESKVLLEAKEPGLAGPTAPACGLYLMRINYPHPLESYNENL